MYSVIFKYFKLELNSGMDNQGLNSLEVEALSRSNVAGGLVIVDL